MGRVGKPSEGVKKLLLGDHSTAVSRSKDGRAGGGVGCALPLLALVLPGCVLLGRTRTTGCDGCVLIIQLGRWSGKSPIVHGK